jgi:uncharacterized protein (DUF1778 family)
MMYMQSEYSLPMADPRSERLNLRVAARDDELFRRAAAVADESLSEFLVASGRERAERLLADRTRFVLSAEDWDAFMEMLERPARVNPKIARLLRRPRPR